MANKVQILDKIARNLDMLKIEYSRDVETLVVANGSNDLTISYVTADIASPLGGVDDSLNPFLGIGTANPGRIQMAGAGVNTANAATVGEVIDSLVAATTFHLISGFANSIKLVNANAGVGANLEVQVEGHQDLVMMGQ